MVNQCNDYITNGRHIVNSVQIVNTPLTTILHIIKFANLIMCSIVVALMDNIVSYTHYIEFPKLQFMKC